MLYWSRRSTSIVVAVIIITTTAAVFTIAFQSSFHQTQQPFHRICHVTTTLTNSKIHDDEITAASSNPSLTWDTTAISNRGEINPLTCPFRSRYYPRIVPIPNRKRRKDEIQQRYDNGIRNKFWIPGQRTYIRQRFIQQQQILRHPTVTCNVHWVDRNITSSSISKSKKYGHILAFASLWDIVGNATASTPTTLPPAVIGYDDKNRSNQNRTIITVIALPDGDGYIMDQFVTTVQWLLERQQLHNAMYISYENIQIDFMTIPTIVLTQQLHIIPSPFPETASATTRRAQHHLDHVITQRTKSWVQRVLVDTTICPFTKSITYSGQGLSDVNVPVGKIAYHTSQSLPLFVNHLGNDSDSCFTIITAVCQLQSDVLVAIYDMMQAGPTYSMKQKLNGISSILLAAPGWDDHFELWTRIVFPILEVTVQILDLTEQIGIVCFHPYYQTPDGRSFPGFGHMHSVPRLQQWLLEHTPQTDIDHAIETSIPDLLKSNIISSMPEAISKEDSSNSDDYYNAAISAIATAGGAWQRRTPHATINVLRADQLAAAESKRTTSKLYSTNILRLNRIGWSQLQQALDHERDME